MNLALKQYKIMGNKIDKNFFKTAPSDAEIIYSLSTSFPNASDIVQSVKVDKNFASVFRHLSGFCTPNFRNLVALYYKPKVAKISGICLDKKNRAFKGVRVQVKGGETYKARRKQNTPLIGQIFPEVKEANYAGYHIDLPLPPLPIWFFKKKLPLRLEYRLEDGGWNLLEEFEIKLPISAEISSRLKNIFGISSDNEVYEQDRAYQVWLNRNKITESKIDEMQADIAKMPNKLLFSIICPVYNTPENYLSQCIESVIAQVYPNWELCLADDNSSNPKTKKILKSYSEKDERIKVVFRNENGHICRASNDALKLASGDFVGLLDHDDMLTPDALYQVAKVLAKNPELDMIYSDEDKIDEDNNRFDPYFKPDFNSELLLSQNFFCHLGIYRKSLVEDIGGFRIGYEGSQDWDFCLRCYERTNREKIFHIEKVLYHWRAITGSTAKEASEKPYAENAGIKAVQSHLNRIGVKAEVKKHWALPFNDVVYTLPKPLPKISVIIPTRNHVEFIKKIVTDLLERTNYDNLEILIVDNESDEIEAKKFLGEIKQNERVRVMEITGGFNYARLNNMAIKSAEGEFICLLNNDISVIDKNWLLEMLRHAGRKGVGAVGAKLLFPDGRIQHAGVVVGITGVAGHVFKNMPEGTTYNSSRAQLAQDYLACTAACLLMKKSVYIEAGGMDEDNFPVNYNDIDLCLKIHELGYSNVYCPKAKMIHLESASRKKSAKDIEREKCEIEVFSQRWQKYINHDPYYNSNFSRDSGGFKLAL